MLSLANLSHPGRCGAPWRISSMSMSTWNKVLRPPRRRASVAWRFGAIAGLCALSIAPAWTQASPELRQVLERLDPQNQALMAELHALREQLAAGGSQSAPEQTAAAAAPTVEERLEVQEAR